MQNTKHDVKYTNTETNKYTTNKPQQATKQNTDLKDHHVI